MTDGIPAPLHTVLPGLSADEIDARRDRIAVHHAQLERERDTNEREYLDLTRRIQELEAEDATLYRRRMRMAGLDVEDEPG